MGIELSEVISMSRLKKEEDEWLLPHGIELFVSCVDRFHDHTDDMSGKKF